jgi:hypothetical protein
MIVEPFFSFVDVHKHHSPRLSLFHHSLWLLIFEDIEHHNSLNRAAKSHAISHGAPRQSESSGTQPLSVERHIHPN